MPQQAASRYAVIEVTISRRQLSRAYIRQAIVREFEEQAKVAKAEFEKTTRTWEHDVTFETEVKVTRGTAYFVVRTDDEVWRMLNQGTRPHAIRAVRAPMLRFRTGYHAKTVVGRMWSGAGGSYGPLVSRKSVMHPGTQARDWTGLLKEQRAKVIGLAVQKAIARAVRRRR